MDRREVARKMLLEIPLENKETMQNLRALYFV